MKRATFLKTLTGLLASPFIPAAPAIPALTKHGARTVACWKFIDSMHDYVKMGPEWYSKTYGNRNQWFFFTRRETKEDGGIVTGHVEVSSAPITDESNFFNIANKSGFDGFILPSSDSLAARVGSRGELDTCITPQIPYLKNIEDALKGYCDAWIEYAADHEVSEAEAHEFATFANFIKFGGKRLNFSQMIVAWEERTGLKATPSHVLLHFHLMTWRVKQC